MSSPKKYTYDEVYQESLKYFNGDSFAAKVFVDKYALQDNENNYIELTPDDCHKRLAKEFARIELKYPNPLSEEEIYNLFKNFKYIVPQGSPMSAIGNSYQLMSASNCFVIDGAEDSYGGIFRADQEQAQIMKRRGGVGHDVSYLRPAGFKTSNAAKSSTGPITFMKRFSNTTREVAQGGRRGALMLTMSCFEKNTQILTEHGLKPIEEIVKTKYSGKVWTHEGFKEIEDYQEIPNRKIYEVRTENGKIIEVTADHKFMVKNTKTQEEYLKELLEIDPEVEEFIFFEEI